LDCPSDKRELVRVDGVGVNELDGIPSQAERLRAIIQVSATNEVYFCLLPGPMLSFLNMLSPKVDGDFDRRNGLRPLQNGLVGLQHGKSGSTPPPDMGQTDCPLANGCNPCSPIA
jgi:hypothetical protein